MKHVKINGMRHLIAVIFRTFSLSGQRLRNSVNCGLNSADELWQRPVPADRLRRGAVTREVAISVPHHSAYSYDEG